jgi:CRISPR-associated protein Csb2
MLALAFTFPAGRYHATPWGRHVNEGAVAWPPEPWRLIRALIATWHHKAKFAGRHEEATLRALVESLAEEPPQYALPAASHSHTRHYMPQWKAGNTSLVFDAFTAIAPKDPLYVMWPTLDLPEKQAALLDDLLAVMGYLGRAESWVDAARVSGPPDPNCVPGNRSVDEHTGELRGEVVSLFASLPVAEYTALRSRFLADERAARRLASTLPEGLLEALSVDTAELRKSGWNRPPAVRKVSYLRPIDALRPKRSPRKESSPTFTTVRYLLVGKPQPRVEDTVRIGELFRQAVMSQAKRNLGEASIPRVLSGHELPGGNRHQHAFYLPFDANGDGRIDRVLLHVPARMGSDERRIIESVRRIWSREGCEWRIVLEAIGHADIGHPLTDCRAPGQLVWRSITPYLHPWHAKKKFTIQDQLIRECSERGLPQLVGLDRIDCITVGNQKRRPIQFHRFRGKRGLSQPDRAGSFWQLTFATPVRGPLALGFGCHFGLGMFAPMQGRSTSRDR